MNYWHECIAEAFEDAGITASHLQIKTVVEWVEGAHENYGMAHGYDDISGETDAERNLRELRREIEKKERWVMETNPCQLCTTTGLVKDEWGRNQTCQLCDGLGRI